MRLFTRASLRGAALLLLVPAMLIPFGCISDNTRNCVYSSYSCACFNGSSDYPAPNACLETSFGGSICCAPADYPSSGACTCSVWLCSHDASDGCTCGLGDLGATGDSNQCVAPAGGTCCIIDGNSCICEAKTTLCAGHTTVDACSLGDHDLRAAVCTDSAGAGARSVVGCFQPAVAN